MPLPSFDKFDLTCLLPFIALEVVEAEEEGAEDKDGVLLRFAGRLRGMVLTHPKCTAAVRKEFNRQIRKKRRESRG